jgi:hypothetical protein
MKTRPAYLPFMYCQALADISGIQVADIELRIKSGLIPMVQIQEETFIDLRPYLVIAKVIE